MQLRVRGNPELCLLVLEGDRYHRHVLPSTGKVTKPQILAQETQIKMQIRVTQQ